jgi:hypothetical protein
MTAVLLDNVRGLALACQPGTAMRYVRVGPVLGADGTGSYPKAAVGNFSTKI